MYFVFNLDQTISYNNHLMTINSQYMFEVLKEKGHDLVFMTTGAIRNMLPYIDRRFHNETLIGLNGAVICKDGNLQQLIQFRKQDMQRLQILLNVHHATVLAEGEWNYHYNGADNQTEVPVDVSTLAENRPLDDIGAVSQLTVLSVDRIGAFVERVKKDFPMIQIRVLTNGVLQLMPRAYTKWHALQCLGIEDDEYVAIGFHKGDQQLLNHTSYKSVRAYSDELNDKLKRYLS